MTEQIMRENLLALAQTYASAGAIKDAKKKAKPKPQKAKNRKAKKQIKPKPRPKPWSLSTVSKQIHGNQAFLAQFLAGEISTTIKTYYLMVNRLRRKWPKKTPWPKTVPIPKLGKKLDEGFAE